MPFREFYDAVACGVDRCAYVGCEVHAFVELGSAVYRIYAIAVAGSHLFEVFLRNRLNGRNMIQTVFARDCHIA